jgi:hypothetical protein
MREETMRLYKLFIILFITIISHQSFASKARMTSLSNSRHVLDEQQIFINPLYLNYLDSFVSYESGDMGVSPTTTAKSNAEGLVSFALKDRSRLALAMGHQDANIVYSRKFINDVALLNFTMTQNPLHLFYANTDVDTSYAFSFQYSNYKNRVSSEGESTVGTSFGVEMGPWQLSTQYVLINSAETALNRLDGSGFITGALQYSTDTNHFYVIYSSLPTRAYNNTSVLESHYVQNLRIGLVDSNMKDGHDAFWGAEILTTNIECKLKGGLNCQKTARSVVLPVWFGVEAQALPWMILRGSIRQTILFNQSKDDVGYSSALFQNGTGAISDYVEGPDSVQLAMGMGLDFGNVVVDGTLQAATTTFFDLSNFLSQVSLKYKF